jgi:hypothetical protein
VGAVVTGGDPYYNFTGDPQLRPFLFCQKKFYGIAGIHRPVL